jgi:hypothetical protein
MKLFLKSIALAAKDPKFQGNARDELNRLIDVAEASGLVVWHDDFCFKSTFWDWGNRETGNINWGGYGSSYKPANESYFKFQYPGDTATMNYGSTGKLTTRKGAKPLDAVKALVLPEADADGAMQTLLAKAGANPVLIADRGLKADAIVDLLTKKKCNFLLTADVLPNGLIEALDKAAESKNYFFTLPVGRLRSLLEKAPKASLKRGPKAPPAFADKDDAKAFSKLKALLASQKYEEIDQAIALLPGLPGACDKLLEGISLANGITAWTNDAKAWTAGYSRPDKWGENHAKLPCDLTVLGETFRLAEIPRNDLFNTAEAKRYALFSVINAAPEDCAPAKAIREGLVALHWKEDRLPPLSNFMALRHLYLDGCNGNESIGGITSLAFDSSAYKEGLVLDWVLPIKSLKRLDVSASIDEGRRNTFLKEASFPTLEELGWPDFNEGSPSIPATIRDVWCNSVHIPHSRLGEVLTFPRFRANFMTIQTVREDAGRKRVAGRNEVDSVAPEITPVKDRGEPLPAKELASLKKLLRDDSPEIVMNGLKILHSATPATIDVLLEKSTVKWDDRNVGHFGGYVSGRLGGPLFDSIKRNDLGEAVRMNLLSLASPGFQPIDDIRKEIRDIALPAAVVPIDVSGFNGIWKLKITVDASKSTESWITGLEKLTTLRALDLELTGGGYGSKLEKAFPLGFTPPVNVAEMSIDLNYQEVKVKPDFITVSPNLRKLKIAPVWPLADIPLLKVMDPSKLEDLILGDGLSDAHLPAEDLTGLAPFVNLKVLGGSSYTLQNLNGIELLKSLCSIELEGECLEQISELAGLSNLEKLKLSENSAHALAVAPLANLPALKSMDLGGHGVSDPDSLLKFRPETTIKLKNLQWKKV